MSLANTRLYKAILHPTVTRITGAFLRRQRVLVLGTQNGIIANDVLRSGCDQVVAIENDKKWIEEAEKTYSRNKNLRFKCGNIMDMSTTEEFSGVVGIYAFNDVKVEDLQDTFNHIRTLLKEEGFILGAIPNRVGSSWNSEFLNHWGMQIRRPPITFEEGQAAQMKIGVEPNDSFHETFLYTRETIEKKLYQAGFQKVAWADVTVTGGEEKNYFGGSYIPRDLFFVAFKNAFK